MKFKVLNRFTGELNFTAEIDCDENESNSVKLGLAVKWAIENRENLRDANLRDANLRGANLEDANLWGANLRDANLRDANLRDANLRGVNLWGANLWGANLEDANLRDANLRDANLRGVNLWGAKDFNPEPFMVCPEEGSFIGWKKLKGGYIAKLEIPARAKRTGTPISRKCRASLVKTLAIYDQDGNEVKGKIAGKHGGETFYQKGRLTKPDKYDGDFRLECTHGIHFFITRQEAEAW